MIFRIITRATLTISRRNANSLVQQILTIVESYLEDGLVDLWACLHAIDTTSLVARRSLHLYPHALHLLLHLVTGFQLAQILVECLGLIFIAELNVLLEIFRMPLDDIEE